MTEETKQKNDIADVTLALGKLIGTRFDMSKDTLDVMTVIRNELQKAANAILLAIENTPGAKYDSAHVNQGLLELRAAKDTLCAAMIEPYAKTAVKSTRAEGSTAKRRRGSDDGI